MKKLTDYRIANATDITFLSRFIRTVALPKGYEPFGDVFVSGDRVCQVIIQYDGTPLPASENVDSDARAS